MKLLGLTVLFLSIQVSAKKLEMVTIKTDADRTQVAVVSIHALADQSIPQISYDNGFGDKIFSVARLNKAKTSIFKIGPVSILEISTQTISASNVVLMVRYLYNFSIFGSERRVKKIQMRYVSPSNLYEAIDLDTKRVIRNAFAYVRYVKGKSKGIDRIETW